MNKGIAYSGYYTEFYKDRDWSQYSYLFSDLIKNSKPGPILDLGAGVGFFVELADKWGIPCSGLEGSAEAIQSALQRNRNIKLTPHLLCEPLPLENESVQTIFINQVIEHLDVARIVLKESFRVLKSGGMIYITSPGKANLEELKADKTHINMYAPTELEALVKSFGFMDIRPLNYNLPFLGKTALSMRLASLIFRFKQLDSLSATANLLAYKP